LLQQEDIAAATQANIQNFTQDAVDIVQQMLRQASEKNDYATMGKLQKMVEVLQQASAPPPEVAFIEQLLETPDAAALDKMLTDNAAMVNDQFLEALNGLVAQVEQQGANNPEAQALSGKLSEVYKIALKFSMKKNMA
jgi:thioredoxin-like negative regulator of GroEL